MNITLSIDEQLVERARETLRATGKSLNQEIREHLQHLAGDDDLERDLEFLERTSGLGKPEANWKFNRDDVYEERLRWPRR
jgi:predicted ArsR family transcriptional regulator